MSDVASIEDLPLKEADMVLGILVNSTAGMVSAAASVRSFDDDEVYGIVTKSLPRMIEAQGGPELAKMLLAAAVTRLVRQKMEAGA